MSPSQPRALVIIATYNERPNLGPLLDRLLSLTEADILVIDDSSPDGTGRLADQLAAYEPRIQVRHRSAKGGVASAHVLGFQYALDRGYDLVVEMDADFSHPPEDVPRLLDACTQADIAVGSRNVPGGRVVGRSQFRNLLTWAGNWYARFVLRLPIRDCTGGFRCTRRAALEMIAFDHVRSRGYGFQLELNHAWTRAAMCFSEVPIVFHDRVAGKSKMSTGILIEALLVVPQLRLRGVGAAMRAVG
jgi:dolichol-phosphate mannosyltransferase